MTPRWSLISRYLCCRKLSRADRGHNKYSYLSMKQIGWSSAAQLDWFIWTGDCRTQPRTQSLLTHSWHWMVLSHSYGEVIKHYANWVQPSSKLIIDPPGSSSHSNTPHQSALRSEFSDLILRPEFYSFTPAPISTPTGSLICDEDWWVWQLWLLVGV